MCKFCVCGCPLPARENWESLCSCWRQPSANLCGNNLNPPGASLPFPPQHPSLHIRTLSARRGHLIWGSSCFACEKEKGKGWWEVERRRRRRYWVYRQYPPFLLPPRTLFLPSSFSSLRLWPCKPVPPPPSQQIYELGGRTATP